MLVLDRSQPVFDRSKRPEALLDEASIARGLKQHIAVASPVRTLVLVSWGREILV